MKIVFLEVRSKTKVFERVSQEIKNINPDIKIYWIVQNKMFCPTSSDEVIYLIPPKGPLDRDLYGPFDDLDKKVIGCDRFNIHFNSKLWHYRFYRRQIEDALGLISPGIVFGELGNFFTHYACLLSKKNGIPFFDIESSRFPTGCVGVFLYDRWSPIRLRDPEDSDVHEFIKMFLEEKPIPDYMKRDQSWALKLRRISMSLSHKIKILFGFISGERYCTQTPIGHILERRLVAKSLKTWDESSITVEDIVATKKKILLYPLQMQPEFNLEVWGYPWNNQEKIVRHILEKIPDDWVLLLKSNPKPYFEMNRINICSLAKNSNVMLLDRRVSMRDIDPYVDIVATVTGTVQIERILNNRPVYIIGQTPFKKFSCIKNDIESLNSENFESGRVFSLSMEQINQAARYLLEHSRPGIMSEPVSDVSCLSENNIKNLSEVVMSIIGKYAK